MPELKKILIKVIRNNDIKWCHLCYVSTELYDTFFRTTECEKGEFGAFLSVWAKGDFNVNLSMSSYNDVVHLRSLVNKRYAREYAELYALTEEENPRIHGWFRMWISQHMRVEIAARKGE